MAVRCSLLGHDFGATEVEREREERGSEVVVTVTEYESCTRCGERTVLSENTEVRGLESTEEPEPVADEPPAPDAAADTSVPDATDEQPISDAADDADPSDADDADRASDRSPAVETAASADEESESVPTDEDGEPITDDAEILDESTTEAVDEDGRERGAWPDSDDVGQPQSDADEPAAWPEVEADETGETDANAEKPAGGGAVGSTTSSPQNGAAASGIQRAGDAPTPGETGPRDDVPVEFFCPRCSFAAPDDRSSLRAGDICPECKKGYLGERER